MLADAYRIVAVNNTGISIDAGLLAAGITPYSGDGSGGLSYDAETTGSNGGSVSDGGSSVLITVTASTSVGLVGEAEANLSGNTATGANGDVEYYLETSTDGGTNYNRPPAPIAIISFGGTNSDENTNFAA